MWLTGLVAPQHVGSSQTRARTRVPCIGRQILNPCATREAPRRTFAFLISLTAVQGPLLSCQVVEARKGFDRGLGLLAAHLDPSPQPEGEVSGIQDPGPYLSAGPGAAQPAKSLCGSQLPAETEPGRPGHRCLGAEKCAGSSLALSPEKSGEADPAARCLFPPYLGQLCKSGLPDRAGSREEQSVPSL